MKAGLVYPNREWATFDFQESLLRGPVVAVMIRKGNVSMATTSGPACNGRDRCVTNVTVRKKDV